MITPTAEKEVSRYNYIRLVFIQEKQKPQTDKWKNKVVPLTEIQGLPNTPKKTISKQTDNAADLRSQEKQQITFMLKSSNEKLIKDSCNAHL